MLRWSVDMPIDKSNQQYNIITITWHYQAIEDITNFSILAGWLRDY